MIVEAPPDSDPFQESWTHNGARRDLEPDHKAAIYLKILDASQTWQDRRRAKVEQANAGRSQSQKGVTKAEAKQRAPSRGGTRSATAKEIAKAAGVGRGTVERALALKKKAPERFEAVAKGKAKAHQELAAKASVVHAKAIVLRAERRLDAYYRAIPKAKGTRGQPFGKGSGGRKTGPPVETTPTLAELGIDKRDAHAWRLAGRVPEATFNAYLDTCIEKEEA